MAEKNIGNMKVDELNVHLTEMNKQIHKQSIADLARRHRNNRLDKFGSDIVLQNFRRLVKQGKADY